MWMRKRRGEFGRQAGHLPERTPLTILGWWNRRSTPERHRHQMAKDKHASKKMGEGRRKGSFKGKGRGHGSPTTRKSGRSPFKGGRVNGDGLDASDGDISSNDTDGTDEDEAVNEDDEDEPNGFVGEAARLVDEAPLPQGIDPKDVEDPLLDAVPTMVVRQSGNWMEESSDEVRIGRLRGDR